MTLNNPDLTKIEFNYSTLYIGSGITGLVTILSVFISYELKMPLGIKEIIALFTAGIVTTSLIYTAKSLRLNFEPNKQKLEFDKDKFEYDKSLRVADIKRRKEESLKLSAQWIAVMAKDVEIARVFIRQHKQLLNQRNMQEFISALDDNSENVECRRAVISILNYFENMAILIKRDLICEDAMKSCFKTVITDYFKVLTPYIEKRQEESRRFLINFEDLAEKWQRE